MSYIWSNYREDSYFKLSFDGVSPYREADHSANPKDTTVRVNPYSRISHIILPQELIEQEDDDENKDFFENQLLHNYLSESKYADIANLLLHQMAKLDLLRGMTTIDGYCLMEEISINQGRYGDSLKNDFPTLKEQHKDIILYHLASYNLEKQRNMHLIPLLCDLFPRVEHHFEVSTQIFHIYIPSPKNDYHEGLFRVAETLFKPITAEISIMWEYQCFGLIEEEQTMVIDQIGII